MSDPILEVENLRVTFPTHRGDVDVVRGVSFSLGRERLGIVGESGSGKSLTGRSIMRLVPPPGRVSSTRLALLGHDLLKTSAKEMTRIRGKRIAMILQDPKFSLNPVMKVGHQIEESYRLHADADRGQARGKAIEALSAVRIRDPEAVYHLYPHQLSGGMGQRVMIAMMLIADPDILIADEPTSALDVTVQTQVLAIIDDLVRDRGMGLMLISHNLHLVSSFCDRVLVMYAGQVVETCVAANLSEAKHPYTRGLLAALPQLGNRRAELPQLQRDPAWLADLA